MTQGQDTATPQGLGPRDTCLCGWKHPKNLIVFLGKVPPPPYATFTFECPECRIEWRVDGKAFKRS
jgi:hypothetical protein